MRLYLFTTGRLLNRAPATRATKKSSSSGTPCQGPQMAISAGTLCLWRMTRMDSRRPSMFCVESRFLGVLGLCSHVAFKLRAAALTDLTQFRDCPSSVCVPGSLVSLCAFPWFTLTQTDTHTDRHTDTYTQSPRSLEYVFDFIVRFAYILRSLKLNPIILKKKKKQLFIWLH